MNPTTDMVNTFSNFFNDKVFKICESLDEMAAFVLADSHIWLKHRLSTFKEATEDEVRQAIMKSDPDTWTQRAFQLTCTIIT